MSINRNVRPPITDMDHRRIAWLYKIDGLTRRQIAERLDLGYDQVRRSLKSSPYIDERGEGYVKNIHVSRALLVGRDFAELAFVRYWHSSISNSNLLDPIKRIVEQMSSNEVCALYVWLSEEMPARHLRHFQQSIDWNLDANQSASGEGATETVSEPGVATAPVV